MCDREEWISAAYDVYDGYTTRERLGAIYDAGLAARAQRDVSGEAVGVIAHTSDPRGDDPKAFVKWLFGGDETNLTNGTELYTHPQPAQQGSVSEGNRGSCQNCETDWENPANPGQICDACLAARAQPYARQGCVPNGWRVEHREGDPSTIHIYRDSDGAWCGGGIEGDDGGAGLRYEFLSALISATPQPADNCNTCKGKGYQESSDGKWPCEFCKRPNPPAEQEGE